MLRTMTVAAALAAALNASHDVAPPQQRGPTAVEHGGAADLLTSGDDSTSWPVHEVGRGPDFFDAKSARLLKTGYGHIAPCDHLSFNCRQPTYQFYTLREKAFGCIQVVPLTQHISHTEVVSGTADHGPYTLLPWHNLHRLSIGGSSLVKPAL